MRRMIEDFRSAPAGVKVTIGFAVVYVVLILPLTLGGYLGEGVRAGFLMFFGVR